MRVRTLCGQYDPVLHRTSRCPSRNRKPFGDDLQPVLGHAWQLAFGQHIHGARLLAVFRTKQKGMIPWLVNGLGLYLMSVEPYEFYQQY